MTVSHSYTVKCDGDACGARERYRVRNQRTAREKARENGWACGSHGDYCPDCNTKPDP